MTHTPRPTLAGFTLLEIMIVVGIIATLMGLLMGPIINGWIHTRESAAKIQMKTLSIAMTNYLHDFGEFPSFDPAVNSSPRAGAERLYELLCQKFKVGEVTSGPYFPVNESNVHTGPGLKPALISPLNGYYTFGFEGRPDHPSDWVVVDPGLDKLLGGTMDAEKGFMKDTSDANGDHKPDAADNIIEKVSLR